MEFSGVVLRGLLLTAIRLKVKPGKCPQNREFDPGGLSIPFLLELILLEWHRPPAG